MPQCYNNLIMEPVAVEQPAKVEENPKEETKI